MKIVVLDGYTLNPGDLNFDELRSIGTLEVHDRTPSALAAARIGDAEIAFTNKTVITKETLRQCKNLRYIGVLATGYNVVDIEAARAAGISVTNVPAYSTDSVAQHTLALLLECCNRVGLHSELVHKGEWQRCSDFSFSAAPLTELAGKTAGIIGFGRIGMAVARLFSALSMNLLVYSRTPKAADGVTFCSFEHLIANSDVISLHCALGADNLHMINNDSLSKMKNGAILINTARGPLIDEAAVAQALKDGRLSFAALDVLEQEPPKDGSPLIGLTNCIITPHIAWAPYETRARLLKAATENLRCFLHGTPKNIVN